MYKIVITKIEEKEVEEKEYQKIADEGNERDGGPVYGYVPRTIKTTEETTILKQVVSELELSDVIKSINQL